MKIRTYILFLSIIFASCSKQDRNEITLYQLLSEEETGISFRNDLSYTEQVNPYTFRNFYNEAEVALADINQPELIVAGEWMPIRIFSFSEGKFSETTEKFGFSNTSGLWNTIYVEDISGDGKPDILAGNMGLNSRLRTSAEKQVQLYINDFDQNGSLDHIMVYSDGEKAIPWLMKNTLLKQIPSLKKQLPTYASYQNKSLQELFPQDVLAKSLILNTDLLSSSVWINNGNGSFEKASLPQEIQLAQVYAIHSFQGKDKEQFLIFGGNQSKIKPELGSQMGSFAWVVQKSSTNKWKVLLPEESGIYVPGEIRDILSIQIKNENHLLFLRNNENTIAFKIR